MPLRAVLFCLVALCAQAAQAAETPPEQLALWPAQAPIGDGRSETTAAKIFVHHPAHPNGTALVICPGGGYGGLMLGPEGHGIADWLGGHGITGIVLEYRLPSGRPQVPLLDAQRAMRLVRSNAKAWGLDPSRIGIIGFSAGGHLASTLGTHFDAGDAKAADPLDRFTCRPDFMVLIYPVITMGPRGHEGSRTNLLGPSPTSELIHSFSNETQICAHTPPAFIAHAADDTVVPLGPSAEFHDAMLAHQVACEYLVLPSGGHGLNGYQGPMWDAWQTRSLQWLVEQHLAPAAGDGH